MAWTRRAMMGGESASPSASNGSSWDLPVWRWSVAILAASILAWMVMVVAMGYMNHGPGISLPVLPIFLAGWAIMLTAMMLPSELTYIGALTSLLNSHRAAPALRSRFVACFI